MKRVFSRFFSFVLVVVLLLALCVPAFAASGSQYEQKVGFTTWAMHFPIIKEIFGYMTGKVCPSSEDEYHHANSYQKNFEDGYYSCICSYCGQTFTAYESDLQQSYDAQVEELPATGLTSSGHLIWQSRISNLSSFYVSQGSSNFFNMSSIKEDLSDYIVSCSYSFSPNYSSTISSFAVSFEVRRFPISGSYCQLKAPYVFSRAVRKDDGSIYEFSQYYGKSSFVHYDPSNFKQFNLSLSGDSGFLTSASFLIYLPVYEVVPDSVIDFGSSGDTYNIQSRPTSISGDYGIIGDNGQITKVDGDYIVNETTNNYHNPATGTTTPIVDWSYDYGDRTYSLTLEGELSAEVQYGDDHITINENTVNDTGDTITNNYTIYYLVDGGGTEDSDPSPSPSPSPSVPPACNHQWTETSTTPATCMVPGSRILTCSLCNETKTETIPAPGHKWEILKTVNTEYDDSGNKTQDGYTIFECSVCGEQYKSPNGGAPPGGGAGSGSGGSGGVFSGIFGLLVDFLDFFWNTFREFVGEGVKGFLSALMDGTSSIFGLLNPFNWGG